MEEIWKSIVGYEGLYEVSNWGRVRSVDHYIEQWQGGKIYFKGRIKKLFPVVNGYLHVNIYKGKIHKQYLVHRLVATAFLPNPDNLPCVNHKDENKLNNHADNLEWCTNEYNHNYGTCNKRISKTQTNGKLSKIVYMYTLDGKLCGMWPSTKECGRNNFSQSEVAACCRGKYRTHKGFKWSYEPPMPPKALPYFDGGVI